MLQLPLFEIPSSWKCPKIEELPSSWAGIKRICIDTETRDPQLKKLGCGAMRDGYTVGYSITWEDLNKTVYLPIRHQGGDNLPIEQVLNYVRSCAKTFDGELVGANLSYDLDYMLDDGIDFPKIKYFRDIQVADPLIYELHKSYSLKNIGDRYGIQSKDETGLIEAAKSFKVDPKSGLWQLPPKYVALYAEMDSISPLKILREQEKLIEQKGLWKIWNLESKVLPVLVKMRRRGVKIDLAKLEQVEQWALAEEKKALQLVFEQTGCKIEIDNVMNNNMLAKPLQHIGVKLNKTTTGKMNIDKNVLASIDHPVAHSLAWARKVNKVRTTFGMSVRNHMIKGRIHCSFKQIAIENEDGDMKGARYGRLACVNPNLQQQPSRDEFAKFWRSIYTAEEGAIWGCLDYSQQEPRWTTHFADVMGLKGADEAARRYREDPSTDNHSMMADLTGLPRKQAKDVFLGLCYGEGGAKLCRDLGLPTRWAVAFTSSNRRREIRHFENKTTAKAAMYEFEGKSYMWEDAGIQGTEILNKFDANVPFVRIIAKKAKELAEKRGYVITIGGRRLHFPDKGDGSYDFTHKALNRVIQGSSADQTKTAITMIDELMPETFIQLQVHDELDGSFATVEEAKKAAKIMRECISDTRVPFKVDIEIGKNWGEINEI